MWAVSPGFSSVVTKISGPRSTATLWVNESLLVHVMASPAFTEMTAGANWKSFICAAVWEPPEDWAELDAEDRASLSGAELPPGTDAATSRMSNPSRRIELLPIYSVVVEDCSARRGP